MFRRANQAFSWTYTRVDIDPVDSHPPIRQLPTLTDNQNATTIKLIESKLRNLDNLTARLYFLPGSTKLGGGYDIDSSVPTLNGQLLSDISFIERSDSSDCTEGKLCVTKSANKSVEILNALGDQAFVGPFLPTGRKLAGNVMELQFPSLAALGLNIREGRSFLTITFDSHRIESEDSTQNSDDAVQSAAVAVYTPIVMTDAARPQRTASFVLRNVSSGFEPTPQPEYKDKPVTLAQARFVIEPAKNVTPPADIQSYRISVSGQSLSAFYEVSSSGRTAANVKMVPEKNAAIFAKTGVAYDVVLDMASAPAKPISYKIEALAADGKTVLEEDSKTFTPAKGDGG